MHPSFAALLGAALLAAADPPAAGGAVASNDPVAIGQVPSDDIEGLLLEALPPPPTTVVRNTNYFGTVTIDHAAHLRRHAHCGRCHDPGPVGKIQFTPKVAHTRCIGCHQEVAKGPTKCQGCHVKPEPPPVQVAAEAPPPPSPTAAYVSGAMAAFDAVPDPPPDPFGSAFQLGYSAGTGQGLLAAFTSHQDWRTFTVSLERLTSDTNARTSGLVGGGITRQVGRRVSIEGVGLLGIDVYDRPLVTLLPALGLRAGATWYPRMPAISSFSASLTALFDVGSHSAGGMEVGGASVYLTLSTGFSLSSRSR
jgi:hypothetical protein